MFKKIILLTFFSLVFLTPYRNVRAQTSTPKPGVPTVKTGRNEFQLLDQDNTSGDSNPVSLTPTIAVSLLQTSVETIVMAVSDYTDRLTNINKKIGTRIDKLKKAKVKTTTLTTKYNSINRQLNLLRTEVNKMRTASTKFLAKQKDYAVFKKQLLSTQNALKSTLQSEKEIIADLAKYASPSATPTPVIKK